MFSCPSFYVLNYWSQSAAKLVDTRDHCKHLVNVKSCIVSVRYRKIGSMKSR